MREATGPTVPRSLPLPPGPGPVDVVEPVPSGLHRALRGVVLEHARREHRRVFPPVLHVGVPGLVVAAVELGTDVETDHALRVDMVEALVRRVRRPGPDPLVWITRVGPLTVQDLDLAWRASARAAAGELAVSLRMVVADRRSWRDPGTGVGRTWRRLR